MQKCSEFSLIDLSLSFQNLSETFQPLTEACIYIYIYMCQIPHITKLVVDAPQFTVKEQTVFGNFEANIIPTIIQHGIAAHFYEARPDRFKYM